MNRRWRPIKHFAALSAIAAGLAGTANAQDAGKSGGVAQNPLERDPVAIEAGDELFHERCAVCHGQRAQGAMAANLVQTRSVRRGSQEGLFALIRQGIPGTDMPPQPDLEDNRIWQVISYLRSLAMPGQQAPLQGDPDAGQLVFRAAGCASCHIVNGSGGFLGPALDSIAARKSSEAIRRDVLEPNSELASGFESVEVETRDGRLVSGILKSEDTFTLMILTSDGAVEALERAALTTVDMPARSAMPSDYSARLTAEDLGNLLAFLDRQRDPFTPVQRGFGVY